MAGEVLSIVALLVVVFALVARRLERWYVTAPMGFLVAGALVFWLVPDLHISNTSVRLIAEITLVVILFHDASTVRLRTLRHHPGLTIRLLAIGLPLSVLLAFGASYWLLPGLGIAGAWLVAGSVTPTDAGLGAPTVLNPTVPGRIRQALNIESGLNDGLVTPVVLFALAALASSDNEKLPSVIQLGLVPVILALVLGIGGGVVAGLCLDLSARLGISSARGRSIAILAMPLLLWGVAEVIGANGFITAFVGGLALGGTSRYLHETPEAAGLLETGADLLSYIVWFLAGGLLIAVLGVGFKWQWLVLAILALTVVRMVPVFISLLGAGPGWPTRLFIAWFGPRGLATIVFALLTMEELGRDTPPVSDVIGVLITTVVISVFAHGISAQPAARALGRYAREHPVPEAHPHAIPTHGRGRQSHLQQNGHI